MRWKLGQAGFDRGDSETAAYLICVCVPSDTSSDNIFLCLDIKHLLIFPRFLHKVSKMNTEPAGLV